MDFLAPSQGTTSGSGVLGASGRWRAQQLAGLATGNTASFAELADGYRIRAGRHGHVLHFLEELETHGLAPSGQ